MQANKQKQKTLQLRTKSRTTTSKGEDFSSARLKSPHEVIQYFSNGQSIRYHPAFQRGFSLLLLRIFESLCERNY